MSPGEHRVLMGSGLPAQTPEETIAAFRKFYPGKNKDTIEQCIVHQWWKEEPLAFGCERHAVALRQARADLAAHHRAGRPHPLCRRRLRQSSLGPGCRDPLGEPRGGADSRALIPARSAPQ